MLAQATVNGILLGGLYGLATVVWGVMGVINLAHTSFIMLGAYVTYFLFEKLGIDPILSMPFAMIAMFILGYGIQRFILPQEYLATAELISQTDILRHRGGPSRGASLSGRSRSDRIRLGLPVRDRRSLWRQSSAGNRAASPGRGNSYSSR
jgi:hypothetical protein